MLRYLILGIVLMFLVVTVVATIVTLIITVLTVALMIAAVTVPAWYLGRHYFAKSVPRQSPLERLQNLYIEGKIDLFEFERRVEHLLALEK